MMSQPFWVVWNAQAKTPTVKHPSQEAAMREATRLASHNPGQEFHVLSLVGTAIKRDVDWVPVYDTHLINTGFPANDVPF